MDFYFEDFLSSTLSGVSYQVRCDGIEGELACRARTSCRNLVFGGPQRPWPWCSLAHRQRSSEAAGPFCTTAWKPWFLRDPATSNRHRRTLTVVRIEPKTVRLLATYIQ